MALVYYEGKSVSVHSEVNGIDEFVVVESPLFQAWLKRLEPGFRIHSIAIQSIDYFGQRIGFVKMRVRAEGSDGMLLPGVVFLRGDSSTIFVVLECEGREYAAFATQPRLAVGQLHFMEIAGGMVDPGGDFRGQAADELQTELGIKIRKEDLVDLVAAASSDKFTALVPSQGACDERLAIFLHQSTVSREKLDRLRDYEGGIRSEGECIHVRVIPIEEVFTQSQNETAWTAALLYERWKRRAAGSLPF